MYVRWSICTIRRHLRCRRWVGNRLVVEPVFRQGPRDNFPNVCAGTLDFFFTHEECLDIHDGVLDVFDSESCQRIKFEYTPDEKYRGARKREHRTQVKRIVHEPVIAGL